MPPLSFYQCSLSSPNYFSSKSEVGKLQPTSQIWPMPVFINCIGTQPHSFVGALFMDAFRLQLQGWAVRTERSWLTKPKLFTTWLFAGKHCPLCSELSTWKTPLWDLRSSFPIRYCLLKTLYLFTVYKPFTVYKTFTEITRRWHDFYCRLGFRANKWWSQKYYISLIWVSFKIIHKKVISDAWDYGLFCCLLCNI